MKKIIISLAPVKASTKIDLETLVMDVTKSVLEGASMCHLHARAENGDLTSDTSFFEKTFDEIRKKSNMIIQASTGGISDMNIIDRCRPLDYKYTECASLNGGSTNLGDFIYNNSVPDIKYCATTCYEKNIIPEIEVFDISMLQNMELIKETTNFRKPMVYNLVFGHRGSMTPTIESLYAFSSFVPKDAIFGVTHFGRANWDFFAAAISMGAKIIRIGFEDSDYLSDRENATYNYELVTKLKNLINAMGYECATPDEARKILQI